MPARLLQFREINKQEVAAPEVNMNEWPSTFPMIK
jgi:hypothetical protein